jgi:hypothetical protein
MLTEFGGIAYAGRENPDADKAWGYVRSDNISELQQRYTSLLNVVNKVEMFSGFCYTQLTDTFQEANGLLYADRTPKFSIEAIAKATLGWGRDDEDVAPKSVEAGWSQPDHVHPISQCGL